MRATGWPVWVPTVAACLAGLLGCSSSTPRSGATATGGSSSGTARAEGGSTATGSGGQGGLGGDSAVGPGGTPWTGAVGGVGGSLCFSVGPFGVSPSWISLPALGPDPAMNAGGAGGNLGGAGGAAGAAGTTGSGCRITASGSPPDVACTGAAWLKPLGGQGGASGSTISWDDGSTLLWPGPAGDPLQPTTSAQPQRVWVDATTQTNRSVPECAPAQGWTIQIRDQGPDGAIRFSVRSGYLLQDPTTDELTALFGVAVETRTNPYCSSEVGNDQGSSVDPCTSTRQDVSDHVIQTTPPQMVTYGILTRITTPNGAFNVRWDSRTTQTLVSGHGFCDCGAQLPVVGFVASRTTN